MYGGRRIRLFALTTALAVLALGLGGTAGVAQDTPSVAPAPVPIQTDGSTSTRTTGLFIVTGQGFTAGGRVYLAVSDEMGARLYETRWISASSTVPVGASQIGTEGTSTNGAGRGGTLRENFAELCGAKTMMRALDEATTTWSNWLTVESACHVPGTGGPF